MQECAQAGEWTRLDPKAGLSKFSNCKVCPIKEIILVLLYLCCLCFSKNVVSLSFNTAHFTASEMADREDSLWPKMPKALEDVSDLSKGLDCN